MKPVILLDYGNLFIKSGFSSEPSKISLTPKIYADNAKLKLRYGEKLRIKGELKDKMIAEEVKDNFPCLDFTNDYNYYYYDEYVLKNIWDYIFTKKLGLNCNELKERKIMLFEKNINFNDDNRKIRKLEVLFERFNFGYCKFEDLPILAFISLGIETGIMLDIGEKNTIATPLLQGRILKNNVQQIDIGGKNITDYLFQLLQRRGYFFDPFNYYDIDIVRKLKEDHCFVSSNIKEQKLLDCESIRLPDGKRINISNEKYAATEVLFNPYMVPKGTIFEQKGIDDVLYRTIKVRNIFFISFQGCDENIRKDLSKNILLFGGTSRLSGLKQRLEFELMEMNKKEKLYETANTSNIFNFLTSSDYPEFLGASILSNKTDYWISFKDYMEYGPNILYKKP